MLAPRCDITDRAALAALAADHAGEGASLLIHTAGIATVRMHAELTGADVAAVCAAKVAGLAAMADVWPLQPECRILACSSVFGVWGGHGHAAYAASNRLLDMLAAQLRATGTGLHGDSLGPVAGRRCRRGGGDRPDRTLRSDRDAARTRDGRRLWPLRRRPADLPGGRRPARSVLRQPGHQHAARRTASDSNLDRRPLPEVVCTELAATLQWDGSASMDPTASLIDLGLDSLLALDLRKRLRRAVGHSAPVAQMLGGITVNELIDSWRRLDERSELGRLEFARD